MNLFVIVAVTCYLDATVGNSQCFTVNAENTYTTKEKCLKELKATYQRGQCVKADLVLRALVPTK